MRNILIVPILFVLLWACVPAQSVAETEDEGLAQYRKDENELMEYKEEDVESIILGGGCFWCVEAVYERISGVISAVSGYSAGETEDPDYYSVSSGTTGHAEVVDVKFDSSVISLEEILDIFFRAHDPTTLNRQGADVGTQYRSIILYNSEKQKEAALKAIELAQESYSSKIVTEVVKLDRFYVAEDYHQDYFELNPNQAYCQVVIKPKLDKLKLLP